MERILVFSDTHGDISRVRKIIDSISGVTGIIHLGDILRDVYALEKEYPDMPLYYVSGNNDSFSEVPSEKVIDIESFKIFITHGHKYTGFFSNSNSLVYKGLEVGADMVLYGHTHMNSYKKSDGMIVANPGSLTHPRGSEASYGIIEIEDGKLSYANITVDYFF